MNRTTAGHPAVVIIIMTTESTCWGSDMFAGRLGAENAAVQRHVAAKYSYLILNLTTLDIRYNMTLVNYFTFNLYNG